MGRIEITGHIYRKVRSEAVAPSGDGKKELLILQINDGH